MPGQLRAIAIKRESRQAMTELTQTEVTAESGLAGDLRGKPGARQVTVVSAEAWDAACADLGRQVPWTTRRANLLVSGIPLAETTGRVLSIGDLELEITGETLPCDRMDEQVAGLKLALGPEWRGGVTCQVRRSGRISVGDEVALNEA